MFPLTKDSSTIAEIGSPARKLQRPECSKTGRKMRQKTWLLLPAVLLVLSGCANRQDDADSREPRPAGLCDRELQPTSSRTAYGAPVPDDQALGTIGIHLII